MPQRAEGLRVDGAQVPVWLLKATRSFLRSFQWARDAADRLVGASHILIPSRLPAAQRQPLTTALDSDAPATALGHVAGTDNSRCDW